MAYDGNCQLGHCHSWMVQMAFTPVVCMFENPGVPYSCTDVTLGVFAGYLGFAASPSSLADLLLQWCLYEKPDLVLSYAPL
jgi:hypothetical protein